MDYQVEFNGDVYTLPKYNLKIAEQLEKQEAFNSKTELGFKEKCRKMYELVCDLLGQENCEKALGKFNNVDPNELNILYLSIVQVYNKPLTSFNQATALDDIDLSQYDKLIDFINAMDKAKNLAVNKK